MRKGAPLTFAKDSEVARLIETLQEARPSRFADVCRVDTGSFARERSHSVFNCKVEDISAQLLEHQRDAKEVGSQCVQPVVEFVFASLRINDRWLCFDIQCGAQRSSRSSLVKWQRGAGQVSSELHAGFLPLKREPREDGERLCVCGGGFFIDHIHFTL